MNYELNTNDDGHPVKCDTMIEALAEARIVKFSKTGDKTFEAEERCDNYYFAELTREQLIDLSYELLKLAGVHNP